MLVVAYGGFGAMPYCKTFKGDSIILVCDFFLCQNHGIINAFVFCQPIWNRLFFKVLSACKKVEWMQSSWKRGAPSRISAAKHIVEGGIAVCSNRSS
ncbi:hypothetical protein HanHA300_Chr02g0042201 [Helianthus annuus]|nr:hypothetical protein HanHA300_Chr02g0042201 [Helianthus annuus]